MTEIDSESIYRSVQTRYGDKADGFLNAPVKPLELVLTVIDNPLTDACCDGSPDDYTLEILSKHYNNNMTRNLPESVRNIALGCGNPTAIESLKKGDIVLDLGSGGGIDCFLAAAEVGPNGKVIGIDFTPSMIRLANENAHKVGVRNVEFRQAMIENIPFPDGSFDVVMSNCVINLSPDKDKVLTEAYRVLKPDGSLRVSDIVLTEPLELSTDELIEDWSSCITGAILVDDYQKKLEESGFTGISIELRAGPRDGIGSADIVARKQQ
jgi:SAM-dependent methyltransferase